MEKMCIRDRLGSMLTIMIFLVFIDYSYILSIGDQKYKKMCIRDRG